MSFKCKLNVAGKERNIVSVDYGMLQETDVTGRPSSVTRGGKITITVESTGDTDLFKRDSEATLKELKFKEAYIVKYKEDFDAAGDNPLTETFTLSAKEIEMGTAKHTNEWV